MKLHVQAISSSDPTVGDLFAFISLLADMLRLPEETLATSYIYFNQYRDFFRSDRETDTLDGHTLSLCCLSLATKATESPRRLRELLLPAWHILHAADPSKGPLTFPSETYDALRATIVQAELILLRVLRFDLRVPLALNYIPRYLGRAIDISDAGVEDYDDLEEDLRQEYKMVDLMETGLGKACRAKIMEGYKHPYVFLFPARTIAAACLYTVLEDRGLLAAGDPAGWIDQITGGRVDREEADEIMATCLRDKRQEDYGTSQAAPGIERY